MSERKYRQHGYQDGDRERARGDRDRDRRPAPPPGAPAATRRLSSEGAKQPNLMGFHEVVKCARCAAPFVTVLPDSACSKCGQPLHACVQCAHFNTAATFECTQPIPARLSPKDARNTCQLFAVRASWERETSSRQAASTGSSAQKAFDDLFNF